MDILKRDVCNYLRHLAAAGDLRKRGVDLSIETLLGNVITSRQANVVQVFYATSFHIAILTHILAVVMTIPYWQGDSTSWIWQTYSMAQCHILTIRWMAVAIYDMVDSPRSPLVHL